MTIWYVSTTGGGNGTIGSPWGFQVALNNPGGVIQPGDTIYLRAGTYNGEFTSGLSGTAGLPITIQAYPQEVVTLEAFLQTTLAAPMTAVQTTCTLTDASKFSAATNIWIDNDATTNFHGEIVNVQAKSGNSYNNCQRGWNGTNIFAHNAGALVWGWNNAVNINGAYTTWRDFIVKVSNPYRSFNFNTSAYSNGTAPYRGEGFEVEGNNITVINCIFLDCEEAIYSNSGDALEVHGCIIGNGGLIDTTEGHGQTLYFLNPRTSPVKLVRDVISFNSFGSGMKAYSESQDASNVHYDGVISFNNGSPDNFAGNPGGLTNHHREVNIFIGTGNTNFSPSGCQVTNCVLYHPPEAEAALLGNMTIGHGEGGGTAAATGNTISNSYIMGSQAPLTVDGIGGITVTNNVIYAKTTQTGSLTLDAFYAPDLPSSAWTWDNNTYYDQNAWYPYTFAYSGVTHGAYKGGDGGNFLQFNQANTGLGQGWTQWTGFDTHSTYNHARPTGVQVVLRPNEYQAGRAHIAIMNWDLLNTVNVNVSTVLTIGATFKLWCAEDPIGTPVLTGTYLGGTIAVPMTGTTVAAPFGLGYTPATVRPEFGAFLLIQDPLTAVPGPVGLFTVF